MPFDVLPGAADRAVALMAHLAAHRWAEACHDFDSTMAMRLDAAGVEEAWTQVTNRVGRYVEMGVPRVGPIGDYTVVDLPLTFETGRMVGRVSYDIGGSVAGLFILDASATGPSGSAPQ